MNDNASPLGRYDSAGDGANDDSFGDEELHEVTLLRVPVRILVAGREHHDGLMREFALLALAEERHRSQLPARLIELTEILGVKYGRASARPTEEIEAAVAQGKETIDITYVVPAHVVEAAATLDALMSEADAFCESEQLLTLKREDVLAEFGEWYLEEFRRQIAGEPPSPWAGPLDIG
ncbi:MAG: ATP-binding region ATPase domain protein [Frankiales bacterium]|nr:ATP-binding region ATPase domain protein [Frankiales bacterium]